MTCEIENGVLQSTERRWVLLLISDKFFMEMCVEGWQMPNRTDEIIQCVKGLPKGCVSRGIVRSPYNDSVFCIIVEHESFAAVSPSTKPPEFTCEFQQTRLSPQEIVWLHIEALKDEYISTRDDNTESVMDDFIEWLRPISK